MFADALTMWRDMMRAGTMVAETLGASERVIGARRGTIASALTDPFNADHAELALMVQEKANAFAQAGAALAGSWIETQGDLAAQVMAMTGSRSLRGVVARQRRIGNAALAGSMQALRPIHSTVTANDRRLRKR